ncbi:hypothetical protein VC74_gp43 [Mycobacterium phage Sparky]|uniref:Uncharacterized protein n=1 Tax=Mycobacterium phage Sparky TaxID=1527493 RepID=A0A076G7F9_9CAUD|nr:hypothetical protein VC74_gp43 [Mycobacterium phage Sparky]AII28227.1 hypothetical protein PBI_SPARKY_83 [Mycobacterium phage Sparky]
MRVGNYVRLAQNGAVYEIVEVTLAQGDPPRYRIAAGAKHPKAAKRAPDALRWYQEHELIPVVRTKAPR